MERVEPR